MPTKKSAETPEQQAERFKKAVQEMVDAGELNPIDADKAFEGAMRGVTSLHRQWFEGGEDQESPDSTPSRPA
jgi:polyhydroxyalkanoate synthesis regulator phasin